MHIDGQNGKNQKHVFLLTRLMSLQDWAKTFNLPHTSPLAGQRILEN